MQVFLLFLLSSFFIGINVWQKGNRVRNRYVILMCILLIIAYYFLDQM